MFTINIHHDKLITKKIVQKSMAEVQK